jgi:hypothetical protein
MGELKLVAGRKRLRGDPSSENERDQKRRDLKGTVDHKAPTIPLDGETVEQNTRASPGSGSDYGSDLFEGLSGEEFDKLTKASPGSWSDYGSDPFEGLNSEKFDALTKASSGSGSDYGSDLFEGLSSEGFDGLTKASPGSESDPNLLEGLSSQQPDKASQGHDRGAGAGPKHKYDDLRSRLERLQDAIFQTLLPEDGFTISPVSEDLASASERFHAAVEILHVRASTFEHRVVSVISKMPQGLERMKSIQKLSPVIGNFQVGTQGDLARIARECVTNGRSNEDERVQAQKFLSIARDHLDWTGKLNDLWKGQLDHENFSKRKEIRPLARAAEKELMEEFACEMQERAPLDDQLSQSNFGTIIEHIEQHIEPYPSVRKDGSALTKDQIIKLRQSAYQVRRITEQLDFTSSRAEKHMFSGEQGSRHAPDHRGLEPRSPDRDGRG